VIRGSLELCASSAYKNCSIGQVWWLTPVILATQEVEIKRIEVQGQFRQEKFTRPHLNQWVGEVTQSVIPAMRGSTNRRILVQAGLGTKQGSISKSVNIEMARGVVQAVQHPPGKYEALNLRVIEPTQSPFLDQYPILLE
jgi:hypothetical protein